MWYFGNFGFGWVLCWAVWFGFVDLLVGWWFGLCAAAGYLRAVISLVVFGCIRLVLCDLVVVCFEAMAGVCC